MINCYLKEYDKSIVKVKDQSYVIVKIIQVF